MSSAVSAHQLFATRPGSRALLDVAVTSVALIGALSQLAHGGLIPVRQGVAELDLSGVVLAICISVPLLAWRRFPLAVFVVTATCSVLSAGLGYPLDLALGPVIALFLLAASRTPEAPWTTRTTVIVAGLFVAYFSANALAHSDFPGPELLHTGLAATAAWFAGERTRQRRQQMAQYRERALHAERDAAQDRKLAIAEERARIARDLHDSAGHAISLIAVRAGAARLRHQQDSERSLAALTAIEELARQTAGEINQIVVTLRDGDLRDDSMGAPSGLASLDTLIAHHAATGMDVTIDGSGTARALSGIADQAAYRIVQEALTNAARYGSGTAAIILTYGDDELELTVTNPITTAGTAHTGGGHGLIGMRERAALLGGDLEVSRTNGVFHVHATIPYEGRLT